MWTKRDRCWRVSNAIIATTRKWRLRCISCCMRPALFRIKCRHNRTAMLTRTVGVPRGRRLVPTIELLLEAAARRRNRVIANVTAAVELSAAQRTRLATILGDVYGKDIQINATVDPEVLGGIRVQVGAEVVDGTVLARLDDARRRLVG